MQSASEFLKGGSKPHILASHASRVPLLPVDCEALDHFRTFMPKEGREGDAWLRKNRGVGEGGGGLRPVFFCSLKQLTF